MSCNEVATVDVSDVTSAFRTGNATPASALGTKNLGPSDLVREIKAYLISLLREIGVPVERNRLPWTTLPSMLWSRNLELVNWAIEVPRPGDGRNDQKGINGFSMAYLRKLYSAINCEDANLRLGFRPIMSSSTVVNASDSAMPGGRAFGQLESGNPVMPRSKRPRDSDEASGPPPKVHRF